MRNKNGKKEKPDISTEENNLVGDTFNMKQ